MSVLNCLIVEDEPLAQEVLQRYIADHPLLNLVAVSDDAFSAQKTLAEQKVDLMFLDINLPKISGITFLKTLNRAPAVIFTTAYPEYAVDGFELEAVDYLVKPFSFERFLKGVNKVISAGDKNVSPTANFIFVKADKKVFRLVIDDIIDLEAMGDYVKIRTKNIQQVINSTLKDLLEELPKGAFLRVHKSFAIALNKIDYIEGNYIRIAGKDLPIGATYRDEIYNLLGTK